MFFWLIEQTRHTWMYLTCMSALQYINHYSFKALVKLSARVKDQVFTTAQDPQLQGALVL